MNLHNPVRQRYLVDDLLVHTSPEPDYTRTPRSFELDCAA